MNVYKCSSKNIFIRRKIKCSNQNHIFIVLRIAMDQEFIEFITVFVPNSATFIEHICVFLLNNILKNLGGISMAYCFCMSHAIAMRELLSGMCTSFVRDA